MMRHLDLEAGSIVDIWCEASEWPAAEWRRREWGEGGRDGREAHPRSPSKKAAKAKGKGGRKGGQPGETADAEEASSPAALLRLLVSSPVAATAITGTPSASRSRFCLLVVVVNRSNYSIFSSPSLPYRL